MAVVEVVVGPIVDLISRCVCAPIARQLSHLKRLKEYVETLSQKMSVLSAQEKDVMDKLNAGKVKLAKQPNHEVQLWLRNVREMTSEEEKIQNEFTENKKCLNGCLPNYLKRIKLSKLAVKKIEEVDNLQENCRSWTDLFSDPMPTIGLVIPTAALVGKTTAERTLERVWESLMDPEKGIIGVYGMGGAGKTTIMKHINNRFVEKGNLFDKIIWATVSKDFNVEKLQNDIASTLDKDVSNYKDDTTRAAKLLEILNGRKFMLILDDVWAAFSLEIVGIPHPSRKNGCKLILTTRSREVCVGMDCIESIEVKSLSEGEAWELFKKNVGNNVKFTRNVEKIAVLVARQCACLPLAIVTVGSAMKGKDDIRDWRNALRELESSKAKNMNDKVLARLKFSYDRLSDDKVRECFLYCALYPEDHKIPCKELVKHWIAEGLIDDYKVWEAQMDKGYVVLDELKNSCMLENVGGYKYVKMHDLIRDMAIHITSENNRCIVRAGESLDMKEWPESVERMSLMHNTKYALPDRPKCPKLSTLFLQGNSLSLNISHSFFEEMHNLRVLDLSFTEIKYLPESLSGLENLRELLLNDSYNIKTLPSLSKLTELRVLDLHRSSIEALPESLSDLVNLQELLLWGCEKIKTLPSLSKLTELRVLDLRSSRIEALPESLSDLVNLQELLLDDCKKIKMLPSLSRHTELRKLNLQGTSIKALPEGMEGVVNLSHIDLSLTEIEYLPESLSDLVNLQELSLYYCEKIKTLPSLLRLTELRVLNLEWSGIEALPESLSDLVNLQELLLKGCEKIKKVPSLLRLTELRKLDLAYTSKLQLFPAGVLRNLTLLEELRMRESGWKWTVNGSGGAGIDDIISLSHLSELEIDFEDIQGWTRYFSCGKWQSLKRFNFYIGNCEENPYFPDVSNTIQIRGFALVSQERSRVFPDDTIALLMEDCIFSRGWGSLFSNLKDLVDLRIYGCAGIDIEEGIEIEEPSMLSNLMFMCVHECHEMKNVFSLGLFQHLPNLEHIEVHNCKEIEEIAVGEAGEGEIAEASNNTITLPNLEEIGLGDLPRLKRICKRELICKSLEEITVSNCPLLKKLPLSVDNIPPSLKKIRGEKEWWDALEWDDPNTKILLQPFFKEKEERGGGGGDVKRTRTMT